MKIIKKFYPSTLLVCMLLFFVSEAYAVFGSKFEKIKPKDENLYIPINKVSDGKAHYFRTKAKDGIMVDFFVVKSSDGIIRAAIDSCDVCYRSGKGYIQEGNFMVCTNCGRRFSTDRINEVKGGCNPAPLKREIKGENLVISMKDINANSWYCEYK